MLNSQLCLDLPKRFAMLNITYISRAINDIYIYIYILPYPRRVEFSGDEVIVLPLASIASLFVDQLRSQQPLNGCM